MELSGWSTASTKLAAVFAGLGFTISSRETEIVEQRSRINLRHFISQKSTWRPHLDRDWLRNAWETGALAKQDPNHPFLMGMTAVRNYEWLCRFSKSGQRIRLKVLGAGWEYVEGEEDARLRLSSGVVGIRDLPLAAALGVVGIPVIDISGPDGQRSWILPVHGHKSLIGPAVAEWQTTHLIRRAEPGKLHLALEKEDPEHPLCASYQATYAFGKLNAHVKRLQHDAGRNLILKAPKTTRRAYISEDASDEILDQVRQHFRLPPPNYGS